MRPARLWSGKDDADVVRAGPLASGGDFLLRLACCQGKDMISQCRQTTLASQFPGCSALTSASSRWRRPFFRGWHFG
jgi:hypothetical protein